ncbi:Acetyltransferase (GNAT) family protein [compost metagenome]
MDMTMTPAALSRQAVLADAERCFEIETSAYEGDEAATLEKISARIQHYPQGFLVLEIGGKIVGFINSGCAHEVVMSDEEFKELVGHDGAAPNVVIMSVVVDPAEQGKGYASMLMAEFVARMREMGKETSISCARIGMCRYMGKWATGTSSPLNPRMAEWSGTK